VKISEFQKKLKSFNDKQHVSTTMDGVGVVVVVGFVCVGIHLHFKYLQTRLASTQLSTKNLKKEEECDSNARTNKKAFRSQPSAAPGVTQ
jgi:uncharacterized membrane protein YciS (DUF1049 family)